jgi:excinuclease ABC subunit A
LHFEDIKHLLAVLNRLVERGNTVLVIEHNMDVIKVADYVIDMGPEGGGGGGKLVGAGTPEHIASIAESHTGKFLKAELV